jgi:acetyl esterase/lipase
MRLLRMGCLVLGLAPPAASALAQDAPQLFAPAPNVPPASTAATIPPVRATLTETPPEPTARPAPPQIRSTLDEPAAQSATSSPIPLVRAAFTEAPQVPTARPTPEIRSTVSEPVADEPAPMPTARPDYDTRNVSFADGVSATFDIPYAALPGFRPLTLDIYTPRAQPAALPHPMVVFVHGGGWNSGDSRHATPFTDFPRVLAGLAAQGYVVASINYRLSQEARYPAALQDVKSAIRWLRGHATNYGGDMTRLAVWGVSAGGQLAALAGTTCGVMRFEPEGDTSMDAPSDCAEAVIDWYGATDLQTLDADNGKPAAAGFVAGSTSPQGSYLGCEPAACAPGLTRLSSPLAFISVNAPPFLIQHGAADVTVSLKQSQKLYDALKEKSVPAELVLYPDVGHDFLRKDAPDPATVTKAMAKLTAFLAATFPRIKPQIRRTVAN